MATKIIDLDDLAGEPKHVKLGGKVFKLPPDLPVELWLRLQRQAGQETTNSEAVELLYQQLLGLFRDPTYGDPGISELPIGMNQLIVALGVIYGGDDAAPERPTSRTRSSAGTSSTSAKRRRTKSRS